MWRSTRMARSVSMACASRVRSRRLCVFAGQCPGTPISNPKGRSNKTDPTIGERAYNGWRRGSTCIDRSAYAVDLDQSNATLSLYRSWRGWRCGLGGKLDRFSWTLESCQQRVRCSSGVVSSLTHPCIQSHNPGHAKHRTGTRNHGAAFVLRLGLRNSRLGRSTTMPLYQQVRSCLWTYWVPSDG